jgi:glycosyltransferase involved in cell wall biosynthesis
MPKQRKETFAICIIASADKTINEKNIQAAKDLCSQVILFASTRNESAKSTADSMGIRLITGNSIDGHLVEAGKLDADWFLCIRSDELIKYTSANTILSFIKKGKQQIYGVYVREFSSMKDYENFTFIRNLGQYSSINEEAGVIKIEPRFVKKQFLPVIIGSLVGHTDADLPFAKIIHGLQLIPDKWDRDRPADQEEKDHDLHCLKGEKMYGSTREDQIDELNIGYNGFRVVNQDYLDGYLEIARRGWGTDDMYLPMLDFLNGNGCYEDAKTVYDEWIKNRIYEQTAYTYGMGGMIYANLFRFEESVSFYENALKLFPNHLFFDMLGKINLILNNREKAINYLEMASSIRFDNFTEKILSNIKKDDWHPLTLSVCIIARDEERTISKALSSVRTIADEIVVVDTGSRDNTMNIARSFGAKVVQIPWRDDFSEARNAAIDSATKDYILMLDADEFIGPSERFKLALSKNFLPASCDEAYLVRILNDEAQETASVSMLNNLLDRKSSSFQTRLFPRRSDVRYRGFVFESVEKDLESVKIQFSKTPFFSITEQRLDVQYRNERKLAAAKRITDLDNSNTALDYALFFLKFGDLNEASEHFRRTNNIDPLLVANIVNFYAMNNKLEGAKNIAVQALTDSPDSFDLNMALAAVYFRDESYAAIYNTLSPFIGKKENQIPAAQRGDFLFYMGIAALEKNLNADAVEYIARALETNFLDTRYQIAGLYAFAKADNWEQFISASGEIVHQETIDIDFEIKDFSDLGRLIFKFIQHFSQKNKKEEIALLRKIIEHMIYGKFIIKEEITRMTHVINEYEHNQSPNQIPRSN